MSGGTAEEPLLNNDEDEEERRRRERQEAIEQMLLAQEQQEQGDNNDDDAAPPQPPPDGAAEEAAEAAADQQPPVLLHPIPPAPAPPSSSSTKFHHRLSYVPTSFLVAAALLYYALRTRQQWYLALVYLSSSKLSLVVFGNALVAAAVQSFDTVVQNAFSGGLRVQEAEGLQDFFRWNVTETCLALTMFRSELNKQTAVEFLVLVWIKCLHQVAVLRENHVRLTQEAVVGVDEDDEDDDDEEEEQDDDTTATTTTSSWPRIPWSHIKLLIVLILLQWIDLIIVQYTSESLLKDGPSVNILFAFEAAILLVAAWSHILLWHLHVVDGLLHWGHARAQKRQHHHQQQQQQQRDADGGDSETAQQQQQPPPQRSSAANWWSLWLHLWKEYKATLTFAVELQAQAVQFLFYLTFFAIVLTYYGMPINLFREVFLSFSALKERLFAFLKYRRLMASMNRFPNATEEQLEESGRVCIICRDAMTVHDCKQLPVCQHLFHKSCLREWLVQQQSCPTCRSDIAAMEAQEAARNAAAQAAEIREEVTAGLELEQQQQQTDEQEETAPDAGDEAPQQGNVPSTPQLVREEGGQRPSLDETQQQEEIAGRRDKTVRFQEGHDVMETATLTTFPALYQVVLDEGAPVWNDGTEELSIVVRTVPFGVIVLCQEVQERQVNGKRAMVLRIPDGWVADDAVLRVHALTTSPRVAASS